MSDTRKGEVFGMIEEVHGGRRYMGKQGEPGKCKEVGRRV